MATNTSENVELIWVPFDKLMDTIHPNPANRVTAKNGSHISRLANSIKESGFLKTHPITVDKKGTIQQGHHRYYGAIEAKSGVWCQIITGGMAEFIRQTKADNITKRWSTEDWIELHARENKNGDFIIVKDFFDKNPTIGGKLMLAILLDKANHVPQSVFESVMQGTFRIKANIARAMATIAQLMEVYDSLDDKFKTGQINMTLGFAVLHMMKHPDYDHAAFISRLRKNKFVPQARREWNIDRLQDIYNKGVKKYKIDFMASLKELEAEARKESNKAIGKRKKEAVVA